MFFNAENESFKMKSWTVVLGVIGAATIGSAADAADLKAPVYKAPIVAPAPVSSWTGFYVGVNAGYSWGKANSTLLPTSIFATPVSPSVNGGLGGAQAGYNWQVDRSWVVGLEADIQATGERGRYNALVNSARTINPLNAAGSQTDVFVDASWKMPWFATFRGRAGWLAAPDWLLYGTGGLAVGEVRFATQLSGTITPIAGGVLVPPGTTIFGPALAESQTRFGWALGAGTEKKFNRNWSAKLEYLYVDFGSKTYFDFGTGAQTDVRFRDHILRAGINYAFDWGPVVAKY